MIIIITQRYGSTQGQIKTKVIPLQKAKQYAGVKVQLHSFFISERDRNLRSASLPIFYSPEDIAPATFRNWNCMWTNFPGNSLLESDPVQFSRWLLKFQRNLIFPYAFLKTDVRNIYFTDLQSQLIFPSFPFKIDLPLRGINVSSEYEPAFFIFPFQ